MVKSKSLKTWTIVKFICVLCVLAFVTFMPYNGFAASYNLQEDTSKITFNLSQNLETIRESNNTSKQYAIATKDKDDDPPQCETYCCLYNQC